MPQITAHYLNISGNLVEIVPTTGKDSVVIEGSDPAPFYEFCGFGPWVVEWLAFGKNKDDGEGANPAGVLHVFEQSVPKFRKITALKPGKYWLWLNGPNTQHGNAIKFEYRYVPAPVARWNGTISDNGSVAANVADMKSLGFDTIRIWFSWNATTGQLTDPKDIAAANAYIAAGINVLVCLTPQMNAATVAYPRAALDAIKKPAIDGGLDRAAVVEIINEPNLLNTDPKTGKQSWYWPRGDWRSAFPVASQISAELQAEGFKTASPAFTYQTAGSITEWWDEAIAKGWTDFDYISGHNYPTVGDYIPSAVANFEDVCKAYAGVGAKLGKPVALTEWGMYGKKDSFDEAWPLLDTIVKKYTQMSAYYIMRELPDNTVYKLHLIDAGGNKTALGKSAMAVAGSVDAKKN